MNQQREEAPFDEEQKALDKKFNKLLLYFALFGFVSALALCMTLEMSFSYAFGLPLIFGLVWVVSKVKS